MIGRTISHYRILDRLGAGGMGVVYKAEDLKLGRHVALKFLGSGLAGTDEDRARFLQEAKAAATLNHPHICIIYGVGEEDGEVFIEMEYVEGVTLRDVISRGAAERRPASTEDALAWAGQIAEALAAAHEQGIVHRDIKPENIMVNARGEIKVMDFGLAKLRGASRLTRANQSMGTRVYMSPEQMQGLDVDARSDLWSLGVVLYELLAGQPPFRGEHEAAVMYGVLNEDPVPLQSLRPDIPAQLQSLIGALLQKDPRRRPATAADVVGQLRRPVEPASAKEEKSIAVLYLENLSPDRESDYFCAGMTEDIITDLSKIRELKVASRTDVLPFRGKEISTRQVGEALGVNYILEGSVRKAGNKVRITGQLIDVRSGFHVWAERFDRLMDDVFELQNEVSRRITDALKISLTEKEKALLAERPTEDLRAYDFYLRGREFISRRGRKNNALAIQMLENALALDPNFPAAMSALAEAYLYMFAWYEGEQRWLDRAVEVTEKALAVDPHSRDTLFGAGLVCFHQKRYDDAKRYLEEVVAENPDFLDARRFLGAIADIEGKYDIALAQYEAWSRARPLSEEPHMHMYMTYLRKGDREAASAAEKRMIDAATRILEFNPDNAIVLSRIAGRLAGSGRTDDALRALKRVLDLDPSDGLLLYNSACGYALMGDRQNCLACLKKSLELGYRNTVYWINIDPDFASIKDDPEFRELVARYGESGRVQS